MTAAAPPYALNTYADRCKGGKARRTLQWQLSMVNGSSLTELLTSTNYQVSSGNLAVTVEGHYGAILAQ